MVLHSVALGRNREQEQQEEELERGPGGGGGASGLGLPVARLLGRRISEGTYRARTDWF